MSDPRILLFDIETAPLLANVWGMWKQNVGWNQLREDWYMLTWAAKWLGEEQVLGDSNHFHGDCRDDTGIVTSLHALLDEADMVIAHNGNRFDIKKVNTRFLAAGLAPPSPYRKIDTLNEAKKNFAFTSNRLDALGDALGLGRKIDTGGFDLWRRCMEGDELAFEEMLEYNMRDVELLESVYFRLRPWMNNHPNLGVYYADGQETCPKCGSTHIQWRGTATTQTGKYRRFQCQNCGGWGRGRTTILDKEERGGILNNVQ